MTQPIPTWVDQELSARGPIQNNGTPMPTRSALNFIACTVADNPGNDSTDVTPSGGGGGGGGLDAVQTASGGSAAITIASTTGPTLAIFTGLTAAGACTLPSAPGTGQRVTVQINDASGLSFNVAVSGNGKTIGSAAASTYQVFGAFVSVVFEYTAATWVVVSVVYPRTSNMAANSADAYTVLRYPLLERTTPWDTVGNAGSLPMATSTGGGYGTPSPRYSSLIGACLDFYHCRVGTADTSVGETAGDLSAYVLVTKRSDAVTGHLVGKQYQTAATGWTTPFISWGMYLNGNGDGTWNATLTIAGTRHTITSAIPWGIFGTAQGCLIGLTYQVSTGVLTAYLNGDVMGTLTITPGASIDWGAHGPYYMGDDGTAHNEPYDGGACDVWVDHVCRSATYMRNFSAQAFQQLPLAG
jgi:hypothetical protein